MDDIYLIESQLYDSSLSIPDKVERLERIRLMLEDIKVTDPQINQELFDSLKLNTRSALDESNKLWNPAPKNGAKGQWVKPDYTYRISDKNPYYNDCLLLDFISCRYDIHGNPDFGIVTFPGSIVDISEMYGRYTIDQLHARGGGNNIQDEAQAIMARNLSNLIIDWWRKEHRTEHFELYDAFFKWRDSLDLVPHEDNDCRTMRLVARSAHKAFTHRGGIANAITIKTYFFNEEYKH